MSLGPVRDAGPGPTADAGKAAEPATCSVELRQLNYDDPGPDDAEFLQLELRVLSGTAILWRDCDVEALVLYNGATPACEIYRTITLAQTPVAKRVTRLRLCAATNTSPYCSPSNLWTPTLKDGWLQNGPDGFGITNSDGQTLVSYRYGGASGCGTTALPKESGSMNTAGQPVDDVIVWCAESETYVLSTIDEALSESDAAGCASVPAPKPEIADAGENATGNGAEDASRPVEDELGVGRLRDSGTPSVSVPLFTEAGPLSEVEELEVPRIKAPSLGCAAADRVQRSEFSEDSGWPAPFESGSPFLGLLFLSRRAAKRRRASRQKTTGNKATYGVKRPHARGVAPIRRAR